MGATELFFEGEAWGPGQAIGQPTAMLPIPKRQRAAFGIWNPLAGRSRKKPPVVWGRAEPLKVSGQNLTNRSGGMRGPN